MYRGGGYEIGPPSRTGRYQRPQSSSFSRITKDTSGLATATFKGVPHRGYCNLLIHPPEISVYYQLLDWSDDPISWLCGLGFSHFPSPGRPNVHVRKPLWDYVGMPTMRTEVRDKSHGLCRPSVPPLLFPLLLSLASPSSHMPRSQLLLLQIEAG